MQETGIRILASEPYFLVICYMLLLHIYLECSELLVIDTSHLCYNFVLFPGLGRCFFGDMSTPWVPLLGGSRQFLGGSCSTSFVLSSV